MAGSLKDKCGVADISTISVPRTFKFYKIVACLGESDMNKWSSNAQWPLDVYRGMDGTGITTDTHRTEKEAKAVCRLLEREGFGGERKHFPIRTWTEKV
jgi:hypothetical protein